MSQIEPPLKLPRPTPDPLPRQQRQRASLARVSAQDTAMRVLDPVMHDPPWWVSADCGVREALEWCEFAGAPLLFAMSGPQIVGMMCAEQLQGLALDGAAGCAVAEFMTPVADMPAIGWETLQTARVSDLLEIFSGAGVDHLIVIENESNASTLVSGVILRRRVEWRLRGLSALS
jgi:hypothetical protein